MRKLGAVLGALGHMTGFAEQLALGRLLNQGIPRSR